MSYKFYIITLIFLLLKFTNLIAYENKILLKIDNEIITTVDISKEINYLRIMNKEINKLEKETIIQIARNAIIREKIKKINLSKNINSFKVDENYLNQLIKNMYVRIGFENLEDFKEYLKVNGVKYKNVKEKIKLDVLWTEFIYLKYKNNIKIDKKQIASEIAQRKNKSYLLSEIVFNIDNKNDFEIKLNNIKNTIKDNGFENAALVHSISNSSDKGGELGWINETSLSKIILENILQINKGEYTRPIKIPGGFIILKINDFKEEKISTNIEEEINKIIKIKTNDQLNQYSNIYFNKIKKDITIYEQ